MAVYLAQAVIAELTVINHEVIIKSSTRDNGFSDQWQPNLNVYCISLNYNKSQINTAKSPSRNQFRKLYKLEKKNALFSRGFHIQFFLLPAVGWEIFSWDHCVGKQHQIQLKYMYTHGTRQAFGHTLRQQTDRDCNCLYWASIVRYSYRQHFGAQHVNSTSVPCSCPYRFHRQ